MLGFRRTAWPALSSTNLAACLTAYGFPGQSAQHALAGGFALGCALPPSAAPAVGNLLYLVMSFFSGFYAPISQMGPNAERIAPYLPTYRFGELAWNAMGAQTDNSVTGDALWLTGYTIIFTAIAATSRRRSHDARAELARENGGTAGKAGPILAPAFARLVHRIDKPGDESV